ncbi:tail fiber assembly protein [Pseudomonas jessenii]|uniref:tail fiber assembly protein n=1 Tax=Pseudomonas jessenii TaxID=77298 RepID=UPI00385718A5
MADGNTPAPRFSEDELKAQQLIDASREVSRLRAVADYNIKPLQDAVGLDEADAEDLTALKLWKKYRVAISKVEAQPEYPMKIDWPSLSE